MEGKVTKCDYCGAEETLYTGTFGGGFGRRWITTHRGTSMSGDKIHTGAMHFCNENCLLAKLTGEKAEAVPPSKLHAFIRTGKGEPV